MSSMKSLKVMIVTDKEYSAEFDTLLQELYDRRIELFCVWGKFCGQWENAMDSFLTDPNIERNHHITTTCATDETYEDLLNMAELWSVGQCDKSVEIVRL